MDGEKRTLNAELLEEILSYIDPPADVVKWGGFLQNIKSIMVSSEYEPEVYAIFDRWSARGENYNKHNNQGIWISSRGTGDFSTMIGLAVSAGLRRRIRPAAAAAADVAGAATSAAPLEISDPNSRFFINDLIEMCKAPCDEKELKRAFKKCIGFTGTAKGIYITKVDEHGEEFHFDFTPNLKTLQPFKFYINGKEKPIALPTLVEMWIMDLKFKGLCFIPYPPGAPPVVTEYFNLFGGFKTRPIPAGPEHEHDLNIILDHIKLIWCRNDEVLTEYVLNWFAMLFQKPDVKPKTCLLLKSRQGCGKNIITDWVGEEIMGKSLHICTSDIDKILGRFNCVAQGKKLIVLDETGIAGKGWGNINDALKARITSNRIPIELKGVDPIDIPDFAGYMILSNHAAPIRIEEGDRRFVCMHLDDIKKGDFEYYDNLAAALSKSAAVFLHYLMSRDLTKFSPNKIPETQMKRDIKFDQLSTSIRFIIANYESWDPKPHTVICSEMYVKYVEWCETSGEKQSTDAHFGRHIQDFGIPRTRVRNEYTRNYVYNIDVEEITKLISLI